MAEVSIEKQKKQAKLIEIISSINRTDVKHKADINRRVNERNGVENNYRNNGTVTSTTYSNESVTIRKTSEGVNKNAGTKENNRNNLKAYYTVTKCSNYHGNFKKNSFSLSSEEKNKKFNELSEQIESKIPKFSHFDKHETIHFESNFNKKIKNKSAFNICNSMSSIFEKNVNDKFSKKTLLSNQEINKSLITSQGILSQFNQSSKKQTAKNARMNSETEKLCNWNSKKKKASKRISDESSEQNKFFFHHQELHTLEEKIKFCIPETSTFSSSQVVEDGHINNFKRDLMISKTCIVHNVSSQDSVSVSSMKDCGASQIISLDTSQACSVNLSEQDEKVLQNTTMDKWCNGASNDFVTPNNNQHFSESLIFAAKPININFVSHKSSVDSSNEIRDLSKYSSKNYGFTRKTLPINHSICLPSQIETSQFPNTSKPKLTYEAQKDKSSSEIFNLQSLLNTKSEFHLQVHPVKKDKTGVVHIDRYSNEIKTESQINNSFPSQPQIETNTLQFLATNSPNTFQENIEKFNQTAEYPKRNISLSRTFTENILTYSKQQGSQETYPIELNSSQRKFENYIDEDSSFQKSGNSKSNSLSESLELNNNKSQTSQMLVSKITSVENILERRVNKKNQVEEFIPPSDSNSNIAHSEIKDEASFFKVNIPTNLSQELTQKPVSTYQDNKRKNIENHFDDEVVEKLLTKNFQRFHKLHVKNNKIDEILQKLSQNGSSQKNDERPYVKKYKKNMEKIYKLKGIRKKKTILNPQKKVTCKDVQIGLSKGFFEPLTDQSEKNSYLTTNSSYKTDETTLENIFNGSESTPQTQLNKQINSEDGPLLYEGKTHNKLTKNEIKAKIQKFLLELYFDLKTKGKCVIRTRKQTINNCFYQDGRLQLKPIETAILTEISSSSQRSKAKFKLFLITLEKIHSLLENSIKITKREFYYQMKNEIDNQWVTDKVINSVSCLLNVGMWELNIFAQKGLVFGNLKLRMASGEAINCNVPGTLIPMDVGNISEIQSTALCILVVEKEAIFHKLIEEDLPNKLSRPFILITGKGFPDLNTQLFLKKLWMVMSIPVFILVDADPHGIKIMLNYRFGSVSHAHVSQHLTVPTAKWLGVYPSEIRRYKMISQPLTDKEIKMLKQLLNTPYIQHNPDIGEEIKTLLEIGVKASIEGLLKSNSFLSENYLTNKFYEQNFI